MTRKAEVLASVPLNYYDLLETLPLPGCAVCNLCERDVNRFLDSHLYEYVNAPDTHVAMRASRFLCNQHTHQLVHYGASVLGIAILESSVLWELLRIAESPAGGGAFARLRGASHSAADRLEPTGTCMACDVLTRAEKDHIRVLAEQVLDTRIAEAYRHSAGLCLPHFRLALRAAPGTAQQERLMETQLAIWRDLKAELDTFASKYDINHAHEAMGEEGDSWRRALELLAGRKGIFGLRGR